MATVVVLALGLSVAHAQDAPPAQTPAPALPPRVGVENGQPLPLSLADAIRLTLEQNNDVTIARLELDASRQDIRLAEGVYDPRVLNAISFQRTVSANASAIGGAVNGRLEQDLFAGNVGLDGLSPWGGGRYTFDFTSSRNESSNQFARLNPQFPSALSLSFVQPLVRGRGIDAERRQIQLARRAVDLTDRQLLQVLMDQLTLVEQAYWDLVFAASNLEVQATALAQAESQVASNERQAREGTLAPIDVVEAQTQLSTFRYTVASAQQALTEAENRLKTLMLANRQAEEWNRPIVPADVNERAAPGLGLPEAVKLAMDRRPELAAIDTQRAQNEIDRAFFSDQAKPQLDIVGTYTLSGLAGGSLQGTANPISGDDAALLARLNELSERAELTPLQSTPQTGSSVPGFLVGSYDESLGNLFSRRYPTALVQLQMELPIGEHRGARQSRTHAHRGQSDHAAPRADGAGNRGRGPQHAPGGPVVATSARRRGLRTPQRPRAVRERAPPVRVRAEHRLPRARTPDDAGHRAGSGAAGTCGPESGHRAARTRRRRDAGEARGKARRARSRLPASG